MFRVEPQRMIEPQSGNLFSLYEVCDDKGHRLALVNGAEPQIIAFETNEVAQEVADTLNVSLADSAEGLPRVTGKRVSTGQYEVHTDDGKYAVEVQRHGNKSTWKVLLPSGQPLEDPFPTKREAMNAIADRAHS